MITLPAHIAPVLPSLMVVVHVKWPYSPAALARSTQYWSRMEDHKIMPIARLHLMAKFAHIIQIALVGLGVAISSKPPIVGGQVILALLALAHSFFLFECLIIFHF